MTLKVSVVIPTLNRVKDIRGCISSLEKQDMNKKEFEIIVVDGGSTDGTVEYLKEQMKTSPAKLRYYTEKRKGAGIARNLGVLESKAPYIAFTDDDCMPEPGWLKKLLDDMPDDVKCAGIGGPIVPADQKNIISRYCDHTRNSLGIRLRDKSIHLPTMNVLYRRSVLLEVGIFDERIIITEDVHLSQKIIKKGYYLKKSDHGLVVHKDPADLKTLYHKSWLYGTGLATIAQIHGVRLKKDWSTLLRDVVLPKTYVAKFITTQKPSLYERLMFGLLRRFWNIGAYNGYRYERKRLHLQ